MTVQVQSQGPSQVPSQGLNQVQIQPQDAIMLGMFVDGVTTA